MAKKEKKDKGGKKKKSGIFGRRRLYKAVAHKLNAPVTEIAKVFETMVEIVTAKLQDADVKRIGIGSLGFMKAQHREARVGRNPATGKSVKIGERTIVRFKASKSLKADLNG